MRKILFRGAALHQPHAFLDDLGQVDRLEMQVELAGFRLGKIQYVVDQRQQMLSRAMNIHGIVAIARHAGAEYLRADHFGKSQNGVQRRAQFMAHQRQEAALGVVGFLGAVQCHGQFLAARFQQPHFRAHHGFGGAKAQIAPAGRHHKTFRQGVGAIRQHRGAEIGDAEMFIDRQRVGAGQLQDGLLAVKFGRILPGIARQEHQPVDQPHDIAAAIDNGHRRRVGIGLQPGEYLAAGHLRRKSRNIHDQIACGQRIALGFGKTRRIV